MNNCKQCCVESCIASGTEGYSLGYGCKKFELRDLTKFEKGLIRHGLIVGVILGFLMGFTLIFQLYYFGVFK